VTVTTARYQVMLALLELPDDEDGELWFQQDGAMALTARTSMALLRERFPGREISRFGDINWPQRSPDLTPPDFFLCAYLKAQCYATKPRIVQELKESIIAWVREINVPLLEWIMGDFVRRLHECVHRYGGHLNDIIFKKWGANKHVSIMALFSLLCNPFSHKVCSNTVRSYWDTL
jgi:hypothetical protein